MVAQTNVSATTQIVITSTIKEIVLIRCTRTALAITTVALIIVIVKGYSSIAQRPSSSEQQKVVDVLSTFFVAAHNDDLAKFNSIIAPGFYIFDNGARFNGDSVMSLIKNLHAAGKRFEWHVTEPDIHLDGNTAWVAYVNKGSITTGSVTSDQQWLESAFLKKQSGNWKIVFIHSTRVPSTPLAQPK
jgi:ketosteroid isomerase-like protein